MKHIWSILCMRSVVDQRTNSISIIDSLEEITVGVKKEEKKNKKIFIRGFNYEIVSFIARENSDSLQKGELSIELFNPQNKPGKKHIQKFDMRKGIKRVRVQISVNGISLSTEGRYIFRIGLNGHNDKSFKIVSELPLDVLFREI